MHGFSDLIAKAVIVAHMQRGLSLFPPSQGACGFPTYGGCHHKLSKGRDFGDAEPAAWARWR